MPPTLPDAYADDDRGRPADRDDAAEPGLAPAPPPGLDPIELVVEGERWVVSRRAGDPRTLDFDWVSHPHGYGFGSTFGAVSSPSHPDGVASAATPWPPSREELVEHIRSFLSEVDPETGYLRD